MRRSHRREKSVEAVFLADDDISLVTDKNKLKRKITIISLPSNPFFFVDLDVNDTEIERMIKNRFSLQERIPGKKTRLPHEWISEKIEILITRETAHENMREKYENLILEYYKMKKEKSELRGKIRDLEYTIKRLKNELRWEKNKCN